MYKCSIYENRPQICRDYPSMGTGCIIPGCSYKYGPHNELLGECSRCGKCCYLKFDLWSLGKEFIKGAECPYLTKGV